VREVTRTGKPKGRKSDASIRVFLTFVGGQWVMPPGYEKVKDR